MANIKTFGVALVALVLSVPSPAAAQKVTVTPLVPHKPAAASLMAAGGRGVTVTVRDERADKSFIASGMVGPQGEKDKGAFLLYATPKSEDLSLFMTDAARDAAAVLGMKPGADLTLDIVIREFHISLNRLSGFSPMNCVGYGRMEATLSGSGLASPASTTINVAYFDNAVPKWSMKEVADKGLSRMYTFAAWEAVITAARTALTLEPDRAAIKALAAKVDAQSDEDTAREMVFLLGLVAHADTDTQTQLMTWAANSKKQKVHQTAAQALGMLGATNARETFASALSGKKLGGWDMEDYEHVWHLVRAMGLLGEKNLAALVPTTKMRYRAKVDELVAFHTNGTIPSLSPAEKKDYEKALKELVKQRK